MTHSRINFSGLRLEKGGERRLAIETFVELLIMNTKIFNLVQITKEGKEEILVIWLPFPALY